MTCFVSVLISGCIDTSIRVTATFAGSHYAIDRLKSIYNVILYPYCCGICVVPAKVEAHTQWHHHTCYAISTNALTNLLMPGTSSSLAIMCSVCAVEMREKQYIHIHTWMHVQYIQLAITIHMYVHACMLMYTHTVVCS